LVIALEMAERGYRFSNIDLYKSDATKFVVDHETKTIIPSFSSIDGLGASAAISVVEARANGEFVSKEDLIRRTKLNSQNIAALEELHVLDNLPDTDQIDLFSFNF
jgi:DNA polymerase-3 subunit alpha (Gram-positive type)